METTKKYSLEAKELLSQSEMFEIKAGEKVPITGDTCTACAKTCVLCSSGTACTTCKICTNVAMDVVIPLP